jgi:hypothetical protein
MLPARFASGGGDLLAKDDVIFERCEVASPTELDRIFRHFRARDISARAAAAARQKKKKKKAMLSR